VSEQVCRVRSSYHVHSERIYVAGCDQAAALALELLLNCPDWFAGILGFGCVDLPQHQSLNRYHQLRGKRIFIGADLRTPRKALAVFVRTGRLLHAAGLNVTARLYEATEAVTPEMLTNVNHWLMEGVYEANLV